MSFLNRRRSYSVRNRFQFGHRPRKLRVLPPRRRLFPFLVLGRLGDGHVLSLCPNPAKRIGESGPEPDKSLRFRYKLRLQKTCPGWTVSRGIRRVVPSDINISAVAVEMLAKRASGCKGCRGRSIPTLLCFGFGPAAERSSAEGVSAASTSAAGSESGQLLLQRIEGYVRGTSKCTGGRRRGTVPSRSKHWASVHNTRAATYTFAWRRDSEL